MGKTLQGYRGLFEGVKRGRLHRLYFLYGPEEYLKMEFIRELIEAALPEGERAFNLDILYGDEYDAALFDDRIGSYGLFDQRRVVVLRRFRQLTTKQKDHVIEVAEALPESVVLVVETPEEKLDTARLKTLAKVADTIGLAFRFAHLDERETIARLRSRVERAGREIEPEALDLLIESVGTRLIDLGNEVEKILLAAPEGAPIDREVVGAVVGRYRSENLFAFLDLLPAGADEAVLRKLSLILHGGEEPVFVLSMLLRRVVLLMEVRALLEESGGRIRTGRQLAERLAGATSAFYAERLRRQALGTNRQQLELLLNNLRWADQLIKSTSTAGQLLIEEALVASAVDRRLTGESSPIV